LKLVESTTRAPMRSSAPLDSRREEGLASLRRRCHENSIESYRVFARTTPGGSIEERDGLVLADSRATDSMGNVAIATVPVDDPDRLISEAEAYFAPDRRPWILFALPESVPRLERAAQRRELRDEGWFPGLLLDPIPSMVPPLPDGLEVRQVDTVDELQTFERAASRAYEVGSGPVYEGWLNYPGFSFHLAYYHGEPVATATLVASHGVAGIVYVGTVPEARGHGFARAAVWSAIEAGHEQGLGVSALWATPMGRAMYERMGFRPVTDYRIWSPPESPLPRVFGPR
ncbi:MAG: GNAT family N-acetyltransferase, partial [Thermoplasmata archaeon]